MSRNYPYASERTPMPLIEARLRLVKRIMWTAKEALDERTRYCKKHGIDYLMGGCFTKPSQDKEHDRLFWLWNRSHVEAEMLTLRISQINAKRHHIWPYA